ncbi:Isd11p NDAI_0E04530 [Naumovozyma dairenensis CBS 421]|uniref:Complex 1 LYR protein domain-containing protein n=1 Tax=Naumovozyma dairenensis (strain ATCC 10597 / BCRC 20456 / CBS 421 / NBRC 0211 / NRRL Y-12639) TaxID=1071378 RepID=G0WC00_NAUDC|nr:hypothetical protein NDAI_0E04530 [Naumovozyma dairenensis CBS 421]CCD25270.1 hypothetical protein NDAI_0E04530 [Naumovozyma dairenensis CBS 421]
MTAAIAPTRRQVLSLYKQFIKNANQFNNFNFREYFLRKSRASFKQNSTIQDAEKLSKLYQDAKNDLSALKRQSVISQMYTFDKLVVEPVDKEERKDINKH